MESDTYFTGSFSELYNYWQDEDRADRFSKEDTRTPGIDLIIARLETDVHKGIWIDTAIGAGIVQSRLSESVLANRIVGIDISRPMLENIDNEFVEPVLGSMLNLPIRRRSGEISTNFFSLSDYPSVNHGIEEMYRVTKIGGIFAHIDYAEGDGYWTRRQKMHGKQNKKGNELVGNINLRTLEDISEAIPTGARVTNQDIIEYEISSGQLQKKIDLPDKITRRFLITEAYIPRSLKKY